MHPNGRAEYVFEDESQLQHEDELSGHTETWWLVDCDFWNVKPGNATETELVYWRENADANECEHWLFLEYENTESCQD